MTDADSPTAPESLPNYLAEGIPKQDDATLEDIRAFVDDLLAHRQQAVAPDDLPDDVDPVEVEDDGGKGTVVKEKVTCGDESCACMDGGEKHGPYKYRYYYADGSLTSEYIGKA
jgi:hypothetical protein